MMDDHEDHVVDCSIGSKRRSTTKTSFELFRRSSVVFLLAAGSADGFSRNLVKTPVFFGRRTQRPNQVATTPVSLFMTTNTLETSNNLPTFQDEDRLNFYRQMAAVDPEWFEEFVIGGLVDDDDAKNLLNLVEANDELRDLIRAFQKGETIEPVYSFLPNEEDEEEDQQPLLEVKPDEESHVQPISDETTSPANTSAVNDVVKEEDETTTGKEVDESSRIAMPPSSSSPESTRTSTSVPSPNEPSKMPSNNPQVETMVQKAQAALEQPNKQKDETTTNEQSSSLSNVWQPFQDMFSEATLSFMGSQQQQPVAKDVAKNASNNTASSSSTADIGKESPPSQAESIVNKERDARLDTTQQTSIPSTKNDAKASPASSTSVSNNDKTNVQSMVQNQERSDEEGEDKSTVSEDEDERIVRFRMRQSTKFRKAPLQKLRTLGYTADDVLSIDPEALDLILSDRVRKPQRGIPPRWKQNPRNVNGVVEILDKEEALKRIQSAQDGRSSESQPFYNPSPPRSKPRVEIKPKEINGSSESINAKVNGSSGVKIRTPSSNMEAKETAAARKESIIEDGPLRDDNSESGGLFAVYRSEGSFQKVPLDVMEKLGYSEAEVETIQPDALDMIVLEDIPKPKSGIPPRWKLANINEAGDERVLIMDSVEAKQYRPARRKAKRREAEAGRDRASESRKRPTNLSVSFLCNEIIELNIE